MTHMGGHARGGGQSSDHQQGSAKNAVEKIYRRFSGWRNFVTSIAELMSYLKVKFVVGMV